MGNDPRAADERWAFAFSAKKTWKSKVADDVREIASTGRGYTRIPGESKLACVADRSAPKSDLLRSRPSDPWPEQRPPCPSNARATPEASFLRSSCNLLIFTVIRNYITYIATFRKVFWTSLPLGRKAAFERATRWNTVRSAEKKFKRCCGSSSTPIN